MAAVAATETMGDAEEQVTAAAPAASSTAVALKQPSLLLFFKKPPPPVPAWNILSEKVPWAAAVLAEERGEGEGG